jgi:hypothetical protein
LGRRERPDPARPRDLRRLREILITSIGVLLVDQAPLLDGLPPDAFAGEQE